MSSNYKTTNFILLSYPLEPKTPLFGINPPNVYKQVESMERGDNCNSGLVTLFNHNGTHLDAPRHFDVDGKKIVDYGIGEFVFSKARIIDVPKKEDEVIEIQDLVRNETYIQNCDLLLIRTGFHKRRGEKSYVARNPWIDTQAAVFLREIPSLKAIGIDTISISSFSHLEIGEKTHRILLSGGAARSEPKLIIEDLDLSPNLEKMLRVFVIPLLISEADSAPCTVFVELPDE